MENTTSRRELLLKGGAAAIGAATLVGLGGEALARPLEETDATPLALHTFQKIDGTPVYYQTGGTSPHNWQCTPAFYLTLVAWIRDLRAASAAHYGQVRYLRTYGFYVNRPGQHGRGTAMDLSGVRWVNGAVCSPANRDHASANRTLRRRYLAVDATCRCWFHWTLDGWFNSAHHNHIHADFENLPIRLSTSARSDTVFMQSLCNNFLTGTALAVDGVWGPRTNAACARAKRALGIGGSLTNPDTYRLFLRRAARRGFANQYFPG